MKKKFMIEYWKFKSFSKYLKHIRELHYLRKYKGVEMVKNPLDQIIYEEILDDVRPECIVELGSYAGGSGLWFHDHMKIFNKSPRCMTISIDIIEKKPKPELIDTNHIFITADTTEQSTFDDVRNLIGNRAPVLVIEDAEHNYRTTYRNLCLWWSLVTLGSYFVVEDTVLEFYFGKKLGNLKATIDFLKGNKHFKIDREREKYVAINSPMGFLKRVS